MRPCDVAVATQHRRGPEILAQLAAYRPPSAADRQAMQSRVRARLQRELNVTRSGLVLSIAALGTATVALFFANDRSVIVMGTLVLLTVMFALIVVGPIARRDLDATAAVEVERDFSPLTELEAEVALTFLILYPDAAPIIASWNVPTGLMRKCDFDHFEDRFYDHIHGHCRQHLAAILAHQLATPLVPRDDARGQSRSE